MTMKAVISAATLLLALGGSIGEAFASETLVLYASRTKFMQMDAPPGTVVIGNPSIADVTINGSQVFLHGRNYGSTNIMIFDAKGQLAREYEVVVQEGAQDYVTVYKAGASLTYACVGECQPTLKPGDAPGYMAGIAKQFRTVSGLATGQQASDGTDNVPEPPPPAQ